MNENPNPISLLGRFSFVPHLIKHQVKLCSTLILERLYIR